MSRQQVEHKGSTTREIPKFVQQRPMDLTTSAGIQELLSSTPYECTSLVPLAGGLTGHTFRGTLVRPLKCGSTTVVVKHAEDFPPFPGNIRWDATRLDFEHDLMHSLQEPLRLESRNSIIGIPDIYYYDRKNKVVVMQDAGTTLKSNLLAGKINSSQAVAIGCALADFAMLLHTWSKTQPQLCQEVSKHHQVKDVFLWVHYARLGETISMVSDGILEGYQETFERAYQLMVSEMRDPVGCGIIHGDYSTGNTLVLQDTTDSNRINRLNIIDWEISSVAPAFFDIGRLSAEVFLVYHFGKRPEAIKLLDAFLGTYRGIDSTAARCKVAIVFGAHLVIWPIRVQGWGTIGEIEEGVKIGAEYLQRGLQGDVNWLQKSILGELFRESSTQIT